MRTMLPLLLGLLLRPVKGVTLLIQHPTFLNLRLLHLLPGRAAILG